VRFHGGDPTIGPRLRALLTASGLEDVVEQTVANPMTKVDEKLFLAQLVRNMRSAILEAGAATANEIDELERSGEQGGSGSGVGTSSDAGSGDSLGRVFDHVSPGRTPATACASDRAPCHLARHDLSRVNARMAARRSRRRAPRLSDVDRDPAPGRTAI
jgi:hypothetical protein